jgi:conjugal transfer pilin signal peptidase TrbI
MRGLVTLTVVWTLALLPALCAIARVPRRVYLCMVAAAFVAVIPLWLASAWWGYRITENLTSSLDGHIYVYKRGTPFQKGDLVAYRWHGGATYPSGALFIKQVVGLPGDEVRVDRGQVWVGDRYIGVAKPMSKAGVPLAPAPGGVIADGEFFLATPSPDSLDSRYALAGNVKQIEIIGKAYEVF